MGKPTKDADHLAPGRFSTSFVPGAFVLVTLNTPREKFWGALLEITAAGLSAHGINLNSFDDFMGQVREGEAVSPGAVFFPMHRVERIEMDSRNGDIPSLCDRFFKTTGRLAADILAAPLPAAIEVGCTLREAERRFAQATLASREGDLADAARILGISPEQLRRLLESTGAEERGDD